MCIWGALLFLCCFTPLPVPTCKPRGLSVYFKIHSTIRCKTYGTWDWLLLPIPTEHLQKQEQTWLLWAGFSEIHGAAAAPVPAAGTGGGVTGPIDVHSFLPRLQRTCPPDKFRHWQSWHLSQELTGGKALKCQIPSKFSQLFISSLVVDIYPRRPLRAFLLF